MESSTWCRTGMRAASAPPGSKRFELVDQLGAQSVVMGERGKGERAVPGGHLGVVDGRTVLVRAGDEVLGHPLAHFLRRQARRPVAEVGIFLREGTRMQCQDKRKQAGSLEH